MPKGIVHAMNRYVRSLLVALLALSPLAVLAQDFNAFQNAVADDNVAEVESYIAAGGDPDKQTDGRTALQIAAATGRAEVAKVLLEHGADANFASEDGATIAHAAVMGPGTEVLEMVIAKDVDLDAVDDKGLTPMHYAAMLMDTDKLVLLRDAGADADMKPEGNKSVREMLSQFDIDLDTL